MARNETVWGIDIGSTSLKALHCRESSEPGKIEVIGFDFIEHSKIMSQPGAEPAEILVETLKEFLARNNTSGSRVAISVSGQNTISRFLPLPPVDVKKVPDIIKYEAKQWLPFDLQDVIWDYQPLGKGLPPSGLVLDATVGMFAMKRDIAMKAITPYIDLGIDVDCIQSSQLAVYNYAAFDQLNVEEIDPDNPPDQVVILSVGTDATDVIVTNGVTIWTRSIPIGGNSFTKAMTKSLKLTFAKAEYLKRNPTSGDDPKAVIQAMRSVFNDMLSEVQRSLEYYSSLNRKAKFTKILALGNALKLPGLQRFLGDNLSLEMVRPTLFNRLIGSEVLASPVFKENLSSFGVAYGLVTQLLGESSLSTNLMPKEVVIERIIQEKKPWVLVAAASFLLGLTIAYSGATGALESVKRGEYGTAETKASSVESASSRLTSDAKTSADEFVKVDNVGKNLTGSVEGRIIWLEFFKALNSALPADQNFGAAMLPEQPEERAKAISKQNRIYITGIDTLKISDAAPWWARVKEERWYTPSQEELDEVKKASGGGDSDSAGSVSIGGGEGGEKAILDSLP
ncbi:MAG: pilus assembly protein PilM, partial [Planctomycetaceae bacterium]|nr:pilus assembly protein PilM [Planctomycetaceae bacterium]